MKPIGKTPGGRIPVLLMVRELDQGGVERDVSKIATHLDPERFAPHVGSYNAHGMRFEELRAANVPLLHLPMEAVLSAAAARAAVRLAHYLREHAIQVVHSYDVSGVLGVPVARWVGVPVVISSQLSYRNILDKPTQYLLRMTDPIAHAVLVNCEAMREHLIYDEGVSPNRIELCYNGVDTSRFYPAELPTPGPLAGSSLVIGTVCALRVEKGLLLLQEAFAKVRALHSGMKLVMVGSGVELQRLESNADRLGIAADSVFIPATPEVPFWLRAIDIFVLPSYSEAFSNSLLEAMACGCAVVGSRVGGTPELIGNDERGLLFTPGDAADLAQKIDRLIESQDLRRKLAGEAARFAKTNLSIEIAARRTAAIYERLLARNSRAGHNITAFFSRRLRQHRT